MRSLTIVCRTSALAIVQAERAARLITQCVPNATVRLLTKASAGDKDLSKPLYALGERDVFTKDIDEVLFSGEADFAVHSLKDLSLERVEHPDLCSAVFERDDPRDVALFRADVVDKLAGNHFLSQPLRLGTSSLRRMELVPAFLQKALPQARTSDDGSLGVGAVANVQIVCEPMRGNVDARLRQVLEGKTSMAFDGVAGGGFDGAVLAAAGINRLLAAPKHREQMRAVLRQFRWMVLPLVECPPAPGQGALLIEALRTNAEAVAVVEQMRSAMLEHQIAAERSLLREAGGGCHQRFGAVSVLVGGSAVLIKAGKTHENKALDDIAFHVPPVLQGKRWFAASERMKEFFIHHAEPLAEQLVVDEEAVFVSHHRAAEHEHLLSQLRHKRVWTAGTRSWFELAKRGVWVEGCADGFGFGFLRSVFASPLVELPPASLRILTNTESAQEWQQQGLKASGVYRLEENISPELANAVSNAEAYFWTNIAQYRACKAWVVPNAIHCCPAGRTAERFRAAGIEPITFPSSKAFTVWQQRQNDQRL